MSTNTSVYYKQNRLKQLRAFCYAAQTGSISKAAERLFLSQPSVSLQIQALERELKTTLFERRGPKIRLTPEGEILNDLARPMVQGMDSLSETFAAHCGDLQSGELNIAAGESTILYILPNPMKQFADRYPGIQLKLHNVTGRDGMAMLKADDVDFAVGSMLEVPADINYYPIFTYDPWLITARDHPLAGKKSVTLRDISPYELILPPRQLSTWRIVDLAFQQHNLNYRVVLEVGGWEVIKRYVELGLGISIVTGICITERDIDRLAIIPVGKYFPKRRYGVVLRKGKFLSPQAKLFIEMMRPGFFETESAQPGDTESDG
ncbi:MAG: LysR family transcriptional regulator [Arenicellales bacterium]|nr:LysR family transcriptional regulator [Arenicellales bacterium]